MEFIHNNYIYNTLPTDQELAARRWAQSRGITVLGSNNIDNGDGKGRNGWNFKAQLTTGEIVGIKFNQRSDWRYHDFPYSDLDEMEFAFQNNILFVTMSADGKRCFVLTEEDFGPTTTYFTKYGYKRTVRKANITSDMIQEVKTGFVD